MKKILLSKALSLIILSALPTIALASHEQIEKSDWLIQVGIVEGTIIPISCLDSHPGPKGGESTPCGLNEMFLVIVNISRILVAFTGAAALVMFMYGGVLFIIAAGSQDKIQKGKDAMRAAAIGIIIILSAWIIVNFVVVAFTGGDFSNPARIFKGYTGEKDFSSAPQGGGNSPTELQPDSEFAPGTGAF